MTAKTRVRARPLIVVAASVLCSACPPRVEMCDFAKERGDYRLTVISRLDTGTADEGVPSCELDDLLPGQAFMIRRRAGDRVHGPTCDVYECPPDFPTPSERQYNASSTSNGRPYLCYSMSRQIQVGPGCYLGRLVSLLSTTLGTDAGVYGPANPDGTSRVVLTRELYETRVSSCEQLPDALVESIGTIGLCRDRYYVSLSATE